MDFSWYNIRNWSNIFLLAALSKLKMLIYITIFFIIVLIIKIWKLRKRNKKLIAELVEKTEKITNLEQNISFLQNSFGNMGERFKMLSLETMNSQTSNFLQLVSGLIERIHTEQSGHIKDHESKISSYLSPVQNIIEQLKDHILSLERTHNADRAVLKDNIDGIISATKLVQTETAKVINSLRSPNIRGMWGEMQLKKLVEIAGMNSYCDFHWQKDYGSFRPDLVINLPNNGVVIVDSKVPLSSYMKAMDSIDDKEKKQYLIEHAKHIKNHVAMLHQKKYWEHVEGSADFMIMFLPGECFLSAALEVYPSLIDTSISQGVILASPTTLLGLLKTIAYGWNNLQVSRDLQLIKTKIISLQNIIRPLTDKLESLGKTVEKVRREFGDVKDFLEEKVILEITNFSEKYTSHGQIESHSLVKSTNKEEDSLFETH